MSVAAVRIEIPSRHARSCAAIAVAAVSIGLSGCSTSVGDFKSEGEKFLESPELAKEAGYRFSNANCAEPTSIAMGTQFACTATDNDGDDWEFVVEITGEREITVISGDLVS